MYVACRQLKIQLPSEAGHSGPPPVKLVQPGDKVPEAMTWEYRTLIAHLNLRYLIWESDGKEDLNDAAAPHNAHKGHAAVIPLIFKEMRREPSKETLALQSEGRRESLAMQKAPKDELPEAKIAAKSPIGPETLSLPKASPIGSLGCPGCSKSFLSKRGLISHVRHKHKEGLSPKAG